VQVSAKLIAFVIAITLSLLAAGWLFGHYIFPGEPANAHADLHWAAFVTLPIAGLTALFLMMATTMSPALTLRQRIAAWLLIVVCALVGTPLWLASFVA